MQGFLIIVALGVVIGIIAGIAAVVSTSRENKIKQETVVKTRFIDSSHTATSSSHKKVGSTAGRAIVGGVIAGPVGAIIGGSTGKKKTTVTEHHTTTFMVFYNDGTHKAETVENNTERYQIYMDMLEID